ncbi:MAG: pilus assembly protein PilM [Candidatus Omnitrophica bacterium]|nr:pilus assembly protein PilM [Candidatus Omnitrophota bacterium]
MEEFISSFLNKKNEFLTVEIGTNDLKVARIERRGDEIDVLDLKVVDISRFLEDRIIQELTGIISGFEGLRSPTVVNVIPTNFVIFKNIEIPSTDEKEIKDIIDLQAGRHTPYAREEIILDYVNLGIAHSSYTKVLLVIVKRDVVTKRYDIIKAAGYKSNFAALSAEIISKFYNKSSLKKQSGGPLALVNMDRANMDFIVEHGGENLYIRSVAIMDPEKTSGDTDIKKRIFEGLKGSVESYQSENIEILPDSIYFTGATRRMQGMESEVRSKMSMSNCSIIPQNKLIESGKVANAAVFKTDENVSVLSVLAIPSVIDDLQLNLIPEDVKMRNEIKNKAKLMIMIGTFAMASLLLFCSVFLTNMMFKKLYFQRLKARYAGEIKEANILKQVISKTDDVDLFLRGKGRSLKVLTELFNAIPKEVFMNNVSFGEDSTLVFSGTADSMSRVFTLVTDLENHPRFSNVKVDSTRTRRVEDKELADFNLTLSVGD